MLQYVHDYRLPAGALKHLFSARRLLALDYIDGASDHIEEARCSLEKYLAQDNVVSCEESENGWVKMDDALQLTFPRYELELVCELLCGYLRKSPDCLLASDYLSVVNRCREWLEKPGFANVQECIASKE